MSGESDLTNLQEDRWLLELAAKAAGLTTAHKWNSERLTLEPPVTAMVVHRDGELVTTGWNPLANDCDALRLAVVLGVDIKQYGDHVVVWYGGGYLGTGMIPYEGDPYAATRRAIVLAAADIGRDTP